MPIDNNQLGTDHEQVVASLRQFPAIKLIKTTGDPPDHYEIEYELKGYVTEADGSISIGTLHRIQIDLPFGYPHFSPICKPLSPIYHPDFDSDAIRVADFWNKEKSLIGLILHIGQMISGNTYSSVDPFNQEALKWYEEHRAELPLDNLQGNDSDEKNDDIDTLDDDLFAVLMLEEDAEVDDAESEQGKAALPPQPSVSPPLSSPTTDDSDDADRLHRAIDQKKIFEARRILRQLSHDSTLPGRQEISQSISEVIEKAEQYHREAEEFAKLGKLEEAKTAYEKVEKIVVDYPGLEEAKKQIERSLELSSTLNAAITEPTVVATKPLSSSLPPGIKGIPRNSGVKKKKKPKFSLKTKAMVIGGLCAIILALGLKLYLGSTNSLLLEQARTNLTQAQSLIDRQLFVQAKKKLDIVQQKLDKIWFNQPEKSVLQKQVEMILSSRDYVEGLQGKVKFQGEYIPADQVTTLKEIAMRLDNGADLAEKHNWKLAATQYKEALQLAEDKGLIEKQQEIQQAITKLKLEQALLTARRAEKMEKWLLAAKHYQRAYNLAQSLPNELDQIEIAGRLAEVKFHHLFDQGKQAFVESEWQQAIDFIQQAQRIIENSPAGLTSKKKELLAKNLFQVKLYQTRAKAIQAYNVANWDQAVRLYDQALEMIADNTPLMSGQINQATRNIKHSRLLAIVARDRELAALAERNNDNARAMQYYNDLIAAMDQNQDITDNELEKIRKEVEDKKEALKEKVFIDEKISYLIDNYQRLITQHYPNARPNKLESPQAVLLKRDGNDLIFELSCIEKSRNSNFRLVLNYRYSPATDSWSVYNE